MLDSGTLLGGPRLRILGTDKATVLLTLYLPLPNRDGGVVLTETWAKAIKQTLLNGAIRFIPGGVRHNLTITWDLYDPTYLGRVVGPSNGNCPELTDLYDLLVAYNTGRLAISPCSNREIWYRVACTSDLTRETVYPAGFGKLSLTFEGLDVYDFATLPASTPTDATGMYLSTGSNTETYAFGASVGGGVVTGAVDSSVTWSVNGVTGGNADAGLISAIGIYTSPITVPSTGRAVTITCQSVADPTVSQSVVSTLYDAPAITGIGVVG